MDEETKAKIAATLKGRVPWNKGKRTRKAHRAAISAALLGRTVADETRQRMREAKLGRKRPPMTEEQKAKIARTMRKHFAEKEAH